MTSLADTTSAWAGPSVWRTVRTPRDRPWPSPPASSARTSPAREDIELGGEIIRAGEGITVPLPAGNGDPSAFPGPDRPDLTREARHHHTFDWGVHHCVGQRLARIELQVVLGTLFRRVPTLKVAVSPDELVLKNDSLAYGVHALPVTW